MNTAKKIAEILLREKAIFFRPEEPFTWTSGIKSPVYCDNRLLISAIEAREFIIKSFVDVIKGLEVDTIAGTATAGIPWAAWIAQELRLPLIYVRSAHKDHGRQNVIEGAIKKGSKSILVEDLISTGKSSIAAAKNLQEEDIDVVSVVSIFTYDFNQTIEIFKENKLKTYSLSNFEVLTKVAYDNQVLNDSAFKQVLEWRKSVVFP